MNKGKEKMERFKRQITGQTEKQKTQTNRQTEKTHKHTHKRISKSVCYIEIDRWSNG